MSYVYQRSMTYSSPSDIEYHKVGRQFIFLRADEVVRLKAYIQRLRSAADDRNHQFYQSLMSWWEGHKYLMIKQYEYCLPLFEKVSLVPRYMTNNHFEGVGKYIDLTNPSIIRFQLPKGLWVIIDFNQDLLYGFLYGRNHSIRLATLDEEKCIEDPLDKHFYWISGTVLIQAVDTLYLHDVTIWQQASIRQKTSIKIEPYSYEYEQMTPIPSNDDDLLENNELCRLGIAAWWEMQPSVPINFDSGDKRYFTHLWL